MSEVVESLKAALADRYTVERELGRGGMAIVYLAEDLRHGRKVAIKVLRPELVSAVTAERFLQEIRITAGLAHPHILPLLDSGEAEGFLFYVMPLVEGESLREKLKREGRLPTDEALRIAREIADALSYAHDRDLLHRDIKPENVLLAAGHAVVADFGIAQAVTEAAGERLTDTGVSVGTPAYMSPEQASGERELGGASDVYSLGCVLYEMLAGQPPIVDASVQRIVSRKLLGDFQPAGEVCRELPPQIDAAISRALATDPAERFSKAGELAQALEPVSGPVARRTGLTRVSRLLTATLVAIFVVVLAVWSVVANGWLGLAGRGESADDERSIAVLPFTNFSPDPEDAYFADGIHDVTLTHLFKISSLSVRGRTSVMQYRDTDKNLRQIGEELNARYVLVGGVQRAGGTVRINLQLVDARSDRQIWAEIYDRPLTVQNLLAVQSEVALRVAESLNATLTAGEAERIGQVPTDNLEAYEYYLRGNDYIHRSANLQNRRTAAQLYERATELDPAFALAHARLSYAYSFLSWYGGGREHLVPATAAVNRALELEPDLPEAHLALGYYHYYGSRDYDRALQEFAIAKESDPNDADLLAAIGFVHRRQGRWGEALTDFGQAVELDPRAALWVANLGIVNHMMRRYAEAERCYNRAILLAPDDYAKYLRKATLFLSWHGGGEKARAVLLELPEALTRFFPRPARVGISGIEDPNPIRVLFRTDSVWRAELSQLALTPASSRTDSANYFLSRTAVYGSQLPAGGQQAYFDSARIVLESLVEEQPEKLNRAIFLGIAYAGLGRTEDAVAEGERAVQLLPVSKDAYSGPALVQGLAEILIMVGDHETAIDYLDLLLSIPGFLSVPWLEADPLYDPLRDHPRFQALLERYE